jgi:hypothetical protein
MAILIGTVTIIYSDQGCVTYYPDGAMWGAYPHDTEEYRTIANRLGYGADILKFCQEHDAMHSILADWLGYTEQGVIWKLAHGEHVSPSDAVREEALVQAAQRWIRAGERPIISDCAWGDLKARAVSLLGG